MEEKAFIKERQTVMVGDEKNIEVALPRLSLKKIMAVTDAVDKLVQSAKEKSPQLFEVFGANKDELNLGMEVVKILPNILPVLMEEITKVLAIYLDKDQEWIKDNFDMEDLVAVATPFFENILNQGSHVTKAFQQMFPAKSENESGNVIVTPPLQ